MVQERRSLLVDTLRRYFLGQGYREVNPPPELDVAFERTGQITGVKIFFFSGSPVRDQRALRSLMYRILRERCCDMAYIAVEDLRYGHLPRYEEFKESGIGLLKVGESWVDVAVLAKPLNSSLKPVTGFSYEVPSAAPTDGLIEGFVQELERKILERLERKITEELSKVAPLSALDANGKGMTIQTSPLRDKHEKGSDNGPPILDLLDIDFIKGNPWLQEIQRKNMS